MNRTEAIQAAKNGSIAATISGVLTLAVVFFAMYTDSDGDLGLWNDASNLFDIALVFICAVGIYRKSRAAAVVLFVYFILSRIYLTISLGRFPGFFLSLIFLYYYGKAIQGTFVFHKLEKAQNPEYRAAPRWYYFVGIPLGVVTLILFGLGYLTMTGAMPSTEVLAGKKVPQSEMETLLAEGIIDEHEKVEYFYSAGFSSIMEDGNVLTDRRVISYFKNEEGELVVYELYIPDIRNVELVEEGNYLKDSIYQVNSYDEDAWLQIVLSTESGGDVRFIEALRKKIEEDP